MASLVLGVVGIVVSISVVGSATTTTTSEDNTVAALWGLGFLVAMGAYYSVGEGVWGRTAGKALVGLEVTGPGGRPLGVGRALLRYLCRFISGAALGVGYITAFADPQRKAWHDRLSHSAVVVRADRAVRPDGVLVPASRTASLSASATVPLSHSPTASPPVPPSPGIAVDGRAGARQLAALAEDLWASSLWPEAALAYELVAGSGGDVALARAATARLRHGWPARALEHGNVLLTREGVPASTAHSLRARAMAAYGHHDAARDALAAAEVADPDDVETLIARAWILLMSEHDRDSRLLGRIRGMRGGSGHRERGVAAARAAVAAAPEHTDARAALTEWLLLNSHHDEVEAVVDVWQSTRPSDADLHATRARLFAARRRGRREAVAAAVRALAINPHHELAGTTLRKAAGRLVGSRSTVAAGVAVVVAPFEFAVLGIAGMPLPAAMVVACATVVVAPAAILLRRLHVRRSYETGAYEWARYLADLEREEALAARAQAPKRNFELTPRQPRPVAPPAGTVLDDSTRCHCGSLGRLFGGTAGAYVARHLVAGDEIFGFGAWFCCPLTGQTWLGLDGDTIFPGAPITLAKLDRAAVEQEQVHVGQYL